MFMDKTNYKLQKYQRKLNDSNNQFKNEIYLQKINYYSKKKSGFVGGNKKKPILIYYIVGSWYRSKYGIKFYDNMYEKFHNDKIIFRGQITSDVDNAIKFFIHNIKSMPSEYCKFEGMARDAPETFIISNETKVSLGEGVLEKCVPDEIKKYIKLFDDL